ncbi:insulinase [Cryptosporidium andersoni]|uniref:Insulinase n=1 Tax=Cryptosporidium andersoni TaxID=117008 RepID=A0A1J4MLS7_9CRYT|nr:insulinase [Cryptosporidium andersoni]
MTGPYICEFENVLRKLSRDPLVHRPDIIFGKLENGLDYCILDHKSILNSLFCSLVVHVGSVHEEYNEKGLANFVQKCMLSELMQKTKNTQYCKDLKMNASTDFHYTVFNNTIEYKKDCKNHKKEAKELLEMLECFYETLELFYNENFSKKNQKNIFEIKLDIKDSIYNSENYLPYLIEKQLFKQLHFNTLLNDHWPIGTNECVEKFEFQDIYHFFKKWYKPSNICIFIIGDIYIDKQNIVANLSKIMRNFSYEDTFDQNGIQEFYDIFSVKNRIGYEYIASKIGIPSNYYYAGSPRELLYSNSLINLVSITICTKLELCPLLDEGEIFCNAIDSIISYLLEIHFRKFELSNNSDSPIAIASWDLYNSSREHCCWNSLTMTSDLSNWQDILTSCIAKIKYLYTQLLSKDEYDFVLLRLKEDYKIAIIEESNEDTKILLDSIIDNWLCGSIPLNKTQEYQLFCKVVEHISPEIIMYRCKQLFHYIINYFHEDTSSIEKNCIGSIFICAPEMNDLKSGDENYTLEGNHKKSIFNYNLNTKHINQPSTNKVQSDMKIEYVIDIIRHAIESKDLIPILPISKHDKAEFTQNKRSNIINNCYETKKRISFRYYLPQTLLRIHDFFWYKIRAIFYSRVNENPYICNGNYSVEQLDNIANQMNFEFEFENKDINKKI